MCLKYRLTCLTVLLLEFPQFPTTATHLFIPLSLCVYLLPTAYKKTILSAVCYWSVGVFFPFLFLFIYSLRLVLCCCARALFWVGEWGGCFPAAERGLVAVASLIAERRPVCSGFGVAVARGPGLAVGLLCCAPEAIAWI